MENQVTITEVGAALGLSKKIIPVMNDEEYMKLMDFYSRVLDRYGKEVHQMKVGER